MPGRNYEEEEEEDNEMETDSDENDDEVLLPQPKANAVYNTDAMHEHLEEIGWPESATWMDSLVMPCTDTSVEEADPNDDLARELGFYTQALGAAKDAYARLQESNVPFLRPPDYYAEMVKSDEHMLRVKDRLLSEQRQLAEKDERRKQREAKVYSKEVQAEKLKERAQQKKKDIESVKQWRKVRQNSDFTEGGDDFPIALETEAGGAGSSGRNRGAGAAGSRGSGRRGGAVADRSTPRGGSAGARGSGKKRQMRDEKFGFGGRKGLGKQNNAESSADMSDFKASFKEGRGGKRGGRGGARGGRGRGKSTRPGKARRQQGKSKDGS